jgi:hypothetical protein
MLQNIGEREMVREGKRDRGRETEPMTRESRTLARERERGGGGGTERERERARERGGAHRRLWKLVVLRDGEFDVGWHFDRLPNGLGNKFEEGSNLFLERSTIRLERDLQDGWVQSSGVHKGLVQA